jgi:hypothetical protein
VFVCVCESCSNIIIVYPQGPSKAGKSTLILDLIEKRDFVISERLDHVTYVMGQDQNVFHEFGAKHPEVKFISHWDESRLIPYSLIIFDDLQQSLAGSNRRFITGDG